MKGERFDALCRKAAEGEEKYVENEELLYTGRVLACEKDKVVVEAFGRRYRWPKEACGEASGKENPLGPRTS